MSGPVLSDRPSHTGGFAHLDRARVVRFETPEHVRLGYELAGMGSRAAAVVADYMILTAATVAALVVAGTLSNGPEWLTGLGTSLGVLLLFVIQWGYFFVAEAFFGGLTPGKRWAGVRVIGEAGTPITVQAAALRNLLRIVDLQPIGSSLVGLGLIGLHPRGQRLGDIVAGTVVVRDRGSKEIPEHRAAERPTRRSRLDPKRFDVLERYVKRRATLPKEVRSRLAGRVAEAMGDPVARHPKRTSMALDEILVELYEAEQPLQSYALGTSPQAVQLVRAQREAWERCRVLVAKAGRRGLSALDEDELEEFTTLYRELVADLARARTYGGTLKLRFHLEGLAGEAHNLFYRGAPRGFSLLRWMRSGFPTAFRRHGRLVALASVLLYAPALVTYVNVRGDAEVARRLLPPEMLTRAENAGERLRNGEQYIDVPPVQMSVFSSQVMTNNLSVSFLVAATGIAAGVGSVLLLIFNGVNIGSVFGLYAWHGVDSLLWIFVLSHGVLELTAITVAGAAGLLIGRTVVSPGRRSRARALREEGREALSLLGGASLFLVLAGLIEGFVSPAAIPTHVKLGFAASVAALMVLYLAGGRGAEAVTGVPDS